MSDDSVDKDAVETIVVPSTRFGDLVVSPDSIMEFPSGLIGFQRATRFILLDHKPPFSWLHSADDPNLAFVVIDGAEFGQHYNWKPPQSDKECDFRENDEFAILIIVTVRPDPSMTTANLKAPLFVNIRNRKGMQIIFDDSRYSTRHPLWEESQEGDAKEEAAPADKEDEKK